MARGRMVRGFRSVWVLLAGVLLIALATFGAMVVVIMSMSGGYAGIGGGLAGAGMALLCLMVGLIGAGVEVVFMVVWAIARRRGRIAPPDGHEGSSPSNKQKRAREDSNPRPTA